MSEKNIECPFESEVLMNLESGDIKPHIQTHLEKCPGCKDTAVVHNWMNRFQKISETAAEKLMPNKKLPSADEIWDGAFSVQPLPITRPAAVDEELVKKALLPLRITQAAAYIIVGIGLGFLLFGNVSAVAEFFTETLGFGTMFKTFTTVVKKSSGIPLLYILPVMMTIVGILAFIFTTGNAARSPYHNARSHLNKNAGPAIAKEINGRS